VKFYCSRCWQKPCVCLTADDSFRALSASEVACYKWPDDTQEHRTKRAEYVARAVAEKQTPEPK
jgi:hypothetical protein